MEKNFREYLFWLNEKTSDKAFNLDEAKIDLLAKYYELVLEWNQKMNLTKLTSVQDFAVKHIFDSLLCYHKKYFKEDALLADVGTGAGFPAIPLKIYQKSLKVTLIDALKKRLDFLQVTVESLNLKDVDFRHLRAEDAGKMQGLREKFDLVTARAVARLNILCEFCLPLLKVGGTFIALKSVQYKEELVEAQRAIKVLGAEVDEIAFARLPITEEQRSLFYIRKIKKTNDAYPRKMVLIEKNPL